MESIEDQVMDGDWDGHYIMSIDQIVVLPVTLPLA